jgi:hypothetical protein
MIRGCIHSRFFLIAFALCLLFLATSAHADVPIAAHLLTIPYNDSSSGGLRITISNLSGLRGISNDGTTMYLLNGSGNITTFPMSAITGSPGSSINVTGTLHSVGWGSGGAPGFGSPDGRSMAYSHGCLFLSNSGSLDCVDISDWSVTAITVPSDEPLPDGHGWASETLIDFADGRVGKVSAYASTSTPASGYSSYIRMYTVSGTGKAATIAWSHDYYMFDTEDWNTDDHGIATDGTYLYRIEFSGSHLSDGDFKSWPLQDSGAPSQEYVGSYTEPFANMTYLAHDHTGNRYMTGNYAGNQIYITSASDPGPGPGNPLTPAFSTATSTSGGYTVQVTNYDNSFTWGASATHGSASIDGSGLVTVTGLSGSQTATTTVTTQKSGVPDGSASVATSSLSDTTPPVISVIASSTADTSATITWTTDESASTKVSYSADTSYASSTSETDTGTRVTSHGTSVTSLLSCTSYNFKVVSADASSNYATSSANSFTTTGCSGGATPSSSTSTTVTVAAAATSTVSDSSGNTLTVATPANFTATSTSIIIQIKGLSSDTVLGSIGKPSGLSSAASVVFDVTALINNSTTLDSFNTPVTISYTYTDADVSGLDQSTLKMYHYHGGQWVQLDNCSVTTSAKTITCTAPSFSIFGIFGSPQTSSSGSSSTGGGGVVIGCTDKKAVNYSPYAFGTDTTSCKYASVPVLSPPLLCPRYNFTRVLRFGDKGKDVQALQKFLNCAGFPLASSGPGSRGHETVYFVDRTLKSLDAFQIAHVAMILSPIGATIATGIFANHSQDVASSLMQK